jgi:hypothetical protein
MWARNSRWILPEMPDFHVAFRDLLHAVNLRHETEGVLRIFSPWKIRRLRPGLNPRTWVPKASTLPLDHRSRLIDPYFLKVIFMLLYREKCAYLDSFKATCSHITTATTKKFQIGYRVLNRRVLFTVPIRVKNISKFYVTISRTM